MFRDVGGFWALFSDSLRFFTSIALGFVPKDPLGPDFKPKQNFKKKLENLSKTRSVRFVYVKKIYISSPPPQDLPFCGFLFFSAVVNLVTS